MGGKADELVGPVMALDIIIMTSTVVKVEKDAINHAKHGVSFYIML